MRSKPRGWVARNVIDGLVVLAVLVGSLWVIPRGIGGRERAEPPAAATATTVPPPPTAPRPSLPTAVSTSTSHPQRSAVVGTVRLDGFAQGLAFGAGSLWIASGERLARVDPSTDEVLATIPIAPDDSGPAGVAFGAGAVWVPVAVPGSVWRIDPKANKVVAKIPLGESLAGFIGVTATDGAVWISSGEQQNGERGGILMRIDPHRNRVTARVPLPGVPSDVAATTKASVWVAMTNGQVLEIDAARGHVMGLVDTGGPLGFTQTIALGAGSVWLADPLSGVVLRQRRDLGGRQARDPPHRPRHEPGDRDAAGRGGRGRADGRHRRGLGVGRERRAGQPARPRADQVLKKYTLAANSAASAMITAR